MRSAGAVAVGLGLLLLAWLGWRHYTRSVTMVAGNAPDKLVPKGELVQNGIPSLGEGLRDRVVPLNTTIRTGMDGSSGIAVPDAGLGVRPVSPLGTRGLHSETHRAI